jgi:hypothetical protein
MKFDDWLRSQNLIDKLIFELRIYEGYVVALRYQDDQGLSQTVSLYRTSSPPPEGFVEPHRLG